jgi:hypothetical protein
VHSGWSVIINRGRAHVQHVGACVGEPAQAGERACAGPWRTGSDASMSLHFCFEAPNFARPRRIASSCAGRAGGRCGQAVRARGEAEENEERGTEVGEGRREGRQGRARRTRAQRTKAREIECALSAGVQVKHKV